MGLHLKIERVGILLGLLLLAGLGSEAYAQRPEPQETMIQGHTMYTLMEPGGIPAIFDPTFIPVAEADSLYYAEEPLLAIAVGTEAKAYSIWHLDEHEIVNDMIAGTGIAATW